MHSPVRSYVRLRNLLLLPLLTLTVLVGLAAFGSAAQAATGHDAARRHHHHHARGHHHHARGHHHHAHGHHQARGDGTARAAAVALQQRGDPYVYGATGPRAFDCSGLMQFSFGRAGIRIPRTAAAQSGRARHISRSKLHRGDLMFFNHGGHVYHVAMFLRWSGGRAVMLHAPGSGKRVRIDSPWTNGWFAGTLR